MASFVSIVSPALEVTLLLTQPTTRASSEPQQCFQIHGGISIDAVVVTETLDPKLHGFDLLSEHQLPGLDFPLQVMMEEGRGWTLGAAGNNEGGGKRRHSWGMPPYPRGCMFVVKDLLASV